MDVGGVGVEGGVEGGTGVDDIEEKEIESDDKGQGSKSPRCSIEN